MLSQAHLDGVHLVQGNDELSDTECEGEKGVLSGLAILGDTSFEFTNTGGDDENSAIGLGSTSDHVWRREHKRLGWQVERYCVNKAPTLDEITVTWGINDCDIVLGGLELP